MRQQTVDAPGTQKVRRDRLGGKRARGHEWQRKQKRVRRLDARRLRRGPDDPSLSGVGGLVAEYDTIFGARLRPGDTGLGEGDVEDITGWLDRLRSVVGPQTVVTTRIDAGADCSALFRALDARGVHFTVKARQTPQLLGRAMLQEVWTTFTCKRAYRLRFSKEAVHWEDGHFRGLAGRASSRISCVLPVALRLAHLARTIEGREQKPIVGRERVLLVSYTGLAGENTPERPSAFFVKSAQ